MLKNYIKIALRNLAKHKGFTLINVFGLATSMSICLLIILFMIDQDLKDEHNPDSESIYRVLSEYRDLEQDRVIPYATSPYELKDLLRFNQEGIESCSQLIKTSGSIKFEERIFNFSGIHASSNFLDFFHYGLKEGTHKDALSKNNGAVISFELAGKLFQDKNAVGQLVTINGESHQITGVLSEKLIKSHLTFDVVLSMNSFLSDPENKKLLSNWDAGSKNFYNYFKLKDNTSNDAVQSFLSNLDSKFSEETKNLYSFSLQQLDEINLGKLVKNEMGFTVPFFVGYFFIVLGLVVMLSASFNYMNLSIARALKRAREVGVRKVVGATKRHIITQFLIESQIVMLASLILGILLLEGLVPLFNDLKILRDIDGAITLNFMTNLSVYLTFILFSIGIGLIAGLYPAIYLSSFKSHSALKGTGNAGKSKSLLFRKILVFFQYSFSIIFIITTIIIYQQADIFVSADYGFDRKNVINIPVSNIDYNTFRDELLKRSEISQVSAISDLPVLSTPKNIYLNRIGSDSLIKTASISIDANTISNLDLKLVAGRDFMANLMSDQNGTILINRLAANELGFETMESAIGQTVEVNKKDDFGDHKSKGRIIGVVDNFLYQFTFAKSGPLVMFNDPTQYSVANIRFIGDDPQQALVAIENVWNTFDNIQPFEYKLYDAEISDIDAEFKDLVWIIGLIAFLAIVIACLGQFSMVVQHIELKVKEIGIRKVLGSSVNGLMVLLSKDFLKVIFLSILFATPLAWKINILWTNTFAMHPDVSWGNLSIGVVITLILSISTILLLVIKAAQSNPVESLKHNG